MSVEITLQVSEKNEGTSYPYWVLVPDKNRISTHDMMMSMVGPFFSREEANEERSIKHRYPGKWVIWCLSGCFTRQYRRALDVTGNRNVR